MILVAVIAVAVSAVYCHNKLNRKMSKQDQKITELIEKVSEQKLLQEVEWRAAMAKIAEVEDKVMLNCQASFDSLSSDVSDLRETVTTKADKGAVLDLTEKVHTMQEDISHLSLNFTEQISHINTTLATKADQHDMDLLTEKVTTLLTPLMSPTALEIMKNIVVAVTGCKTHPLSIGVQIVSEVSKYLF